MHPIAFIFDVIYEKWTALLRKTVLRDPSLPFIVMLHDVLPGSETSTDSYACSADAIERFIQKRLAAGYTFVSLDAMLENGQKNTIAVTLDDGFMSVLSVAAPLFRRYAIPYTVYACVGFVDHEGYLTRDALVELSHDPLCTIGSHSLTHPRMRDLSADKVLHEVKDSKAALSDIIQKPVEHFAFPHGNPAAVGGRDVRIAKTCGYKSVALTIPRSLTNRDRATPYRLCRINITGLAK